MFEILKKNIRFFTIQFLTILNENLFRNVIILMITNIFYMNSKLQPELLVVFSTLAFLIPQLFFSTIAGKICDKYNKNYIIRRLKTYDLFVYLVSLIAIWSRNKTILILSFFAVAVSSVFFEIIRNSLVPELTEKENYLKFNALNILCYFIAFLCGISYSYLVLLGNFGFLILTMIFIVSTLENYSLAKQLPFDRENKITLEFLTKSLGNITWVSTINFIKNDIKTLASMAKRKYIFLPALGIGWFWFIINTFINNLEIFTKDYLNTTQMVSMSFLLMFILGLLLGVYMCNRVYKGKINIAFTPISAIFITVLTYKIYYDSSFSTNLTMMSFLTFFKNIHHLKLLLDFALMGLFLGIYIVPLYSFLDTRTRNINRSRVFSAVNLLNYLFMIMASLICYILSKNKFYTVDIYLFTALANLVIGVYAILLLPQSVFHMFGRWVFKLAFNVKVDGIENYDVVKDKRIIVIANHQSFLDACLISFFLDDDLIFAVDVNISKKWWMKPVMALTKCYAIDSSNPMGLKSLINLSKSGKKIMIFPEGRITTTGIMMKIYEGPAMIAEKSNSLLVPIRIEGAQYSIFSRLRNKVKRKLFPDITLTVLPAQKITITQGLSARQKRVEAGTKLHNIMVDLFYSTAKKTDTIFQGMLGAKNIFGGKHKIIEDTNFMPMNYNDLILKSFVLGNYLSHFTEQKEYVGVMLPSAMATMVIFMAIQSRDRIPVMINFSAGIANVLSACSSTKIKYVFSSQKFIEKGKLQAITDALRENNIKVIYLENEVGNITLTDKLLGVLYSKFPNFFYRQITKDKGVNADDTAVVLFTSGSENTPKGVCLSHRNLNANRNQLLTAFNFSSRDILFVALPLFHSFGLGASIISLITGTKMFFYPSPLHYRIIPELIYRTNATIMFATNTFLEKYAKFANPYDFYSLKFIAIGGEKLTENNKLNWADRYSVKVFEGYGATECSPLISFNSFMKYKFGTVGTFVAGLQYRLEKMEGVEEENSGRLFLKGENVFKGYIYADKPLEIVPPKDGWYDTGDIVKIDSEGFITIIGRAKRFAKISGEMVSMTMVENNLSYIWKDYINAVIAEKDDRKGEKLVIITNNKDAKIQDVIDYFKQHQLAEISIPKEIRFREDIPLLGTGKINYIELEKILREEKNR